MLSNSGPVFFRKPGLFFRQPRACRNSRRAGWFLRANARHLVQVVAPKGPGEVDRPGPKRAPPLNLGGSWERRRYNRKWRPGGEGSEP
jgi:hypothetical protein